MPMCITVSKETVETYSMLLKTLDRKCNQFDSNKTPNLEYVYEFYDRRNYVEQTILVLAVARYGNNTYMVYAPENLDIDQRSKLFEYFMVYLNSDDKLLVTTRLDYDAAKANCHCKGVDITLIS